MRVTASTPRGSPPAGDFDTARVRIFVYGFLAVVLAAALLSIELWPITGWRLYIEPRKTTHPAWELAGLDDANHERPVSLYDLPIGYRNTDRQLGPSVDVEPATAARLCRAWAEAFHARDDGIATLRIYRARIDSRSGDALRRQLVQECRASP